MKTGAALDFTGLLLGILGHTDGEFTGLGYEDTDGEFHTAVVAPADAPGIVEKIPSTANTYFSVCTVRGPERSNAGRGKETDATRLTGLWCDLDVKTGGCPSLDVARAIIASLSIILGTRPSAIVESGHGLHAYWPITDGHVTDGDIRAARALIKRWHRLVTAVAEKLNVRVDNVYELARMMRVPDTYNTKNTNGQAPPLVVAHADTGAPLTMAEIDERLTEVGILEQDGDTECSRDEVSAPSEWTWAAGTCPYVAAMIDGWATDGPKPGGGRHYWLVNQATRLACAHRQSCIAETDHRRARQVLATRFAEIVATTDPRREPKKFEITDAINYGITKTATKTDDEVAAELGGHTRDEWARPTDTSDTSDTDDGDDIKHSGHLGMAIKLGKQFKGKLLYVNGIGWHHWDGKRYAPDRTGAARRAVHTVLQRDRRTVKRLNLPPEDEEKRLKEIARYETAPAINGILTEAAALHLFSVTVADIDADPWLFNCANGTLDLRTLQLRPHDPADRITKIANAAYRPDTVGTTWKAFLEKILPDEAVRGFMQRLTSLGLLGEVNGDKQTAPIATGTGANGKTTYTEATSFALGDYAMAAEPGLLMAKRYDTHPTGVADLLGKRFVTTVETEQYRRFDITLLKWLTGGDTLKARFMRQDFFSFKPSHLLLLATNHMPRIDDTGEAVWRRVRVIPFTVEIPKKDRDKDLRDKLRAEADAVLSWIVAGWVDYRKRGGLDTPDAVTAATDSYKADSDAVGRFIADECLTGSQQHSARTKDLYERWEKWARSDGCLPLSRKAFGLELDARGYPADKDTHARLRHGITLIPDTAPEGDSWHTGF